MWRNVWRHQLQRLKLRWGEINIHELLVIHNQKRQIWQLRKFPHKSRSKHGLRRELTAAKASWYQRERWNGGAENDGHENDGPSDRAWHCKTWNCRTWNCKTRKISQLLIIVNIALFCYLYSLYCSKLFEIVYSCYTFKSLVLLLAQITILADLSFDPFFKFISLAHYIVPLMQHQHTAVAV